MERRSSTIPPIRSLWSSASPKQRNPRPSKHCAGSHQFCGLESGACSIPLPSSSLL
jgi:hypothetical protein